MLKKPGGRKKQVQARGKTLRSQSLFFTAFALLAQLIGFFNSPTGNASLAESDPAPGFFAALRMYESHPR